MPRTARAAVRDYCYHVINRGNGRDVVFWIGKQMSESPYSWASMRAPDPSAARRHWRKCIMPLFFPLGVLKVLSSVLLGSLFDESGGPLHA